MKGEKNLTTTPITTRARQMLNFFFFFKENVSFFKSEAPTHILISLTAQKSLSMNDELRLPFLPKLCYGKSCLIYECGSFTNDEKFCLSKHNLLWTELPGPTESDFLQGILEIWACTCLPSPVYTFCQYLAFYRINWVPHHPTTALIQDHRESAGEDLANRTLHQKIQDEIKFISHSWKY